MDSQHDEIVEWILKEAGGRGQNYEAFKHQSHKRGREKREDNKALGENQKI